MMHCICSSGAGSHFLNSGKIGLGHKAGLGADVQPQAAGVAVNPDGRRVLVANYYNDSVSLVDLAARKVVAEQDLRPGKIDRSQLRRSWRRIPVCGRVG